MCLPSQTETSVVRFLHQNTSFSCYHSGFIFSVHLYIPQLQQNTHTHSVPVSVWRSLSAGEGAGQTNCCLPHYLSLIPHHYNQLLPTPSGKSRPQSAQNYGSTPPSLSHTPAIQAFSKSLFPFFRDERGNPRNEEGIPLRHLGQGSLLQPHPLGDCRDLDTPTRW